MLSVLSCNAYANVAKSIDFSSTFDIGAPTEYEQKNNAIPGDMGDDGLGAIHTTTEIIPEYGFGYTGEILMASLEGSAKSAQIADGKDLGARQKSVTLPLPALPLPMLRNSRPRMASWLP